MSVNAPSASTGATPPAPTSSAARAAPGALAALLAALLTAALAPLAATRAEDAPIDLAPYAGKVVYVDFWASWCVPCRASFPWMNALQEELGEDGLVIVGVNTGDDPEAAARFLREVPAEFTLLTDEDGSIAKAYGLKGMPMAFIHDRDGTLVASHVGFNERTAVQRADEMRAFVRGER